MTEIKSSLARGLNTLINFLVVCWFVTGVVLILVFVVLLVNPQSEYFGSWKDLGVLYELNPRETLADLEIKTTSDTVVEGKIKLLTEFYFKTDNRLMVTLWFLAVSLAWIFTLYVLKLLKDLFKTIQSVYLKKRIIR